MGRRKKLKASKRSKERSNNAPQANHASEPRENEIDVNADSFYQDEIDGFHSQREKLLLGVSGELDGEEDSVLDDDEEEEVMSLQLSDSEDDGEEEEEEVLEEEDSDMADDHLPVISDKAWGHSKNAFYNSDYIDGDLEDSEEEEMLAQEEEREGLALQRRMAESLQEHDFGLSSLPVIEGEKQEEDLAAEKVLAVQQDLSSLSESEKLILLQRESPEFMELFESLSKVDPDLLLSKLYCLNVMFYLFMKAKRIPVQDHPVIDRIVQLRNLLGETQSMAVKESRKHPRKRRLSDTPEEAKVEESDHSEEGRKRAITYQIAKNKGLTPKRKKEQRNPRVKHRKKYAKAVIKRKSMVHPVERELDRYGGEKSGIRANLTRSVKIK